MLAVTYGISGERVSQQLPMLPENWWQINLTTRKALNEMQELVRALKNIERFFAEEKNTTEKTQTR